MAPAIQGGQDWGGVFVFFCHLPFFFLHKRNHKDLHPLSYLGWGSKAAEISDVTSKAVWPWVGYTTSLSFSILLYKVASYLFWCSRLDFSVAQFSYLGTVPEKWVRSGDPCGTHFSGFIFFLSSQEMRGDGIWREIFFVDHQALIS